MQPLVSVITPTYNHASYLRECVDSVLSQSYSNLEYIVINDGSQDRTPEILDTYHDTRLVIINQSNMGETLTVNKGFSIARGDIVVVLSSDDRLYNTALAEGVAFLKEHPDILVAYPGYCYIDSEGIYKYRRAFPAVYDYSFMVRRHYCTPGLCSFITRRALSLVPARDPRYRFAADFAYWLKLGQYGPFGHIPQALGDLRVHPQSGSVASRGKAMAEEHERIIRDFFRENSLDPEIERAENEAIAWTYLICGIVCRDSPFLSWTYRVRAFLAHPAVAQELPDLRWFT